MKNILIIDTRQAPYELGYTNEGISSENTIELNFKVTTPYEQIEVTKQDGTVVIIEDNYLPYEIYKTQGQIKIRLLATDYTTDYILFNVQTDLEESDNVIVKSISNYYVIRKISSSGSGGNTGNHAELENLDYASSGHTGFASSTELYETMEKIEQVENNLNEVKENMTVTADNVYFEDGETLEEKQTNKSIDTNADNVYFDDGESLAEKYINGELGGGGATADEIILTYITSSNVNVAAGGVAEIEYNFAREVYTSRSGTEKVYVDGTVISSRSISQGDNTAYISNLTNGSHTVEIEVSSSGLVSSLVYSIEVIELSISSTFDGFSIYSGDITYRYTPVGNIEKTIHFIVDEETYGTTSVTESGKVMTYDLTGLTHGSHSLQVYMTAEINGSTITSNVLNYDLVVNNGGTTTIISCPFLITETINSHIITAKANMKNITTIHI